jgi:hypothetical protein
VCDTNLDIRDGKKGPWATLRDALLCDYTLLPGLREREVGGEKSGKDVVCPIFRERAGSVAGLCVVVDFAMNAQIASSDMKRRQPMTTLASWPVFSKW